MTALEGRSASTASLNPEETRKFAAALTMIMDAASGLGRALAHDEGTRAEWEEGVEILDLYLGRFLGDRGKDETGVVKMFRKVLDGDRTETEEDRAIWHCGCPGFDWRDVLCPSRGRDAFWGENGRWEIREISN